MIAVRMDDLRIVILNNTFFPRVIACKCITSAVLDKTDGRKKLFMMFKYLSFVLWGVVVIAGEMDSALIQQDSLECERYPQVAGGNPSLEGEVIIVDLIENTITIKTGKNEEKKIVADTTTCFTQNYTIGAFQSGDSVIIHYRLEQGEIVATSIIEKSDKK